MVLVKQLPDDKHHECCVQYNTKPVNVLLCNTLWIANYSFNVFTVAMPYLVDQLLVNRSTGATDQRAG